MVDFIVTGFQEASSFEEFNMSKAGKIDAMKIGPEDKYSSMEFSINNRFQIKEIPGKNNKDITMRTSDVHEAKKGTLFSFSIVQPTVTLTFWDKILQMVRLGGPYHVSWIWPEVTDLCILKGSFKQEMGQAEYPDMIYLDNGVNVQAMVGVWTIEFSEYNHGSSGTNAPTQATIPTEVISIPAVQAAISKTSNTIGLGDYALDHPEISAKDLVIANVPGAKSAYNPNPQMNKNNVKAEQAQYDRIIAKIDNVLRVGRISGTNASINNGADYDSSLSFVNQYRIKL